MSLVLMVAYWATMPEPQVCTPHTAGLLVAWEWPNANTELTTATITADPLLDAASVARLHRLFRAEWQRDGRLVGVDCSLCDRRVLMRWGPVRAHRAGAGC